MNRNQRLGLIVAVVAIAVVAFVIAKPGGDDDKASSTGSQASGGSQTGGSQTGGGDTEAKPAPPQVNRIAIKGNKVQGGVKTIEVKKGERVRIVVTVDKPETLHLHGWDIEKDAGPGKPARFDVKAMNEGEFELESHTFEDQGLEPAIAKIRVQPA
jgi:FtsP/CotA-like multicopper oxidase with cupredoxin domain